MYERLFNVADETHMLLQKSKKFYGVLIFEANGITLNYGLSFILSKEAPNL